MYNQSVLLKSITVTNINRNETYTKSNDILEALLSVLWYCYLPTTTVVAVTLKISIFIEPPLYVGCVDVTHDLMNLKFFCTGDQTEWCLLSWRSLRESTKSNHNMDAGNHTNLVISHHVTQITHYMGVWIKPVIY